MEPIVIGDGTRAQHFTLHKTQAETWWKHQILRNRKLSKRVSLLKELWQLHHGTQISTMSDAHLLARQSTWMPTATRCKDCGRLFTGRIMHVFSSITKKMQRYTIYLFLWNALHVSGGSSAHHQALKNCIYSIGYFVKSLLLPATVVEEMENISQK